MRMQSILTDAYDLAVSTLTAALMLAAPKASAKTTTKTTKTTEL